MNSECGEYANRNSTIVVEILNVTDNREKTHR